MHRFFDVIRPYMTDITKRIVSEVPSEEGAENENAA